MNLQEQKNSIELPPAGTPGAGFIPQQLESLRPNSKSAQTTDKPEKQKPPHVDGKQTKTRAGKGEKGESNINGAIKLLERAKQDLRLKDSSRTNDAKSILGKLRGAIWDFDGQLEAKYGEEPGAIKMLNRFLGTNLKVKSSKGGN